MVDEENSLGLRVRELFLFIDVFIRSLDFILRVIGSYWRVLGSEVIGG